MVFLENFLEIKYCMDLIRNYKDTQTNEKQLIFSFLIFANNIAISISIINIFKELNIGNLNKM